MDHRHVEFRIPMSSGYLVTASKRKAIKRPAICLTFCKRILTKSHTSILWSRVTSQIFKTLY